MREWLCNMRLEQGKTQDYVAKKSGIKRTYYTLIETGKRRPSVAVAKALGKELNFDWTIFFEVKGNEKKQNHFTS